MLCNGSELRACIDSQFDDEQKSCKYKDDCIVFSDTRSRAKCEENARKYTIVNSLGEHIALYHIDGGVIKDASSQHCSMSRCDYLFVISGKKQVFTELKGVDVGKALDQIYNTLDLLGDEIVKEVEVYGRIVVASATPRLSASPKFTRLQTRLKKLRGNLKVRERVFDEESIHLKDI